MSRANAPTRLDEINKQTLEIFCDQCQRYRESAWNQQVANIWTNAPLLLRGKRPQAANVRQP